MDILTKEQRSYMMGQVKSKDTMIERKLRSLLFGRGYRFRKNVGYMTGKPDLALKKLNAVIFVNGCFWHGHVKCSRSTLPKTRTNFWKKKIALNIKRDKFVIASLIREGWRVAVLWECLFEAKQKYAINKLINWLDSRKRFLEIN